MVLRIRLARFGNKHNPFYNIVVAQARCVISHLIRSPTNISLVSMGIGLHRAGYQSIKLTELRRSARGAKPLEVIGTFNPIPKRPTNLYYENANARPYKEIALDQARAKYWLGVGAQPSDPVWKLLAMVSCCLHVILPCAGGSK